MSQTGNDGSVVGRVQSRIDSFSGVCAPFEPMASRTIESEIEEEIKKIEGEEQRTGNNQLLTNEADETSEFSELLRIDFDRKKNDILPGSTFGTVFSSAAESSACDPPAPQLETESEAPSEARVQFPFKMSETDPKSESILLDSEPPNLSTQSEAPTVTEIYHEALDGSTAIEPETSQPPDPPPPTQETKPKKSSRQSAVLRPRSSTTKHAVPGLTGITMKKIAEISQRTLRLQSNVPESFKQMILGPPKSNGPTAWEMRQIALEGRREASPYSQEESARIAEDLVNGQKRKIVNAAGIADVIDELTKMLLESMEARDYTRGEKIKNTIQKLRDGFRKEDRERCQKERLDTLKQQIADVEEQLSTAQRDWKEKETEFKETRDRLAQELDEKHDQELRDCRAQWSGEKKRIYNKRSPALLSLMVSEKKLSMIGDFAGANEQKKYNTRSEEQETNEKFREYTYQFESARQRMLERHKVEIREFNETKDRQWMIMKKKAGDEIERHTRRLNTLKKLLEDESNMDIFTAKRLKKGADFVLPMSASMRGGDDIPTAGKTKQANGDDGAMARFRESNAFPGLSLPPLPVRRLRRKPRAFVAAKREKPKIDF